MGRLSETLLIARGLSEPAPRPRKRRARAGRPVMALAALAVMTIPLSRPARAVAITQTVSGVVLALYGDAREWSGASAGGDELLGQHYRLTYSYELSGEWLPASSHLRRYLSPDLPGSITVSVALGGSTRAARDGVIRSLQVADYGYAEMAAGDGASGGIEVEMAFPSAGVDGAFILDPLLRAAVLPGEIWVTLGPTFSVLATMDSVQDVPEPHTAPLFVAAAVCLLGARLARAGLRWRLPLMGAGARLPTKP